MPEEYDLEQDIKRMSGRKEQAVKVMSNIDALAAGLQTAKGSIKAIIAEVDADILAKQLQLDALRNVGDDQTKPQE
jgi:hypothetical protein